MVFPNSKDQEYVSICFHLSIQEIKGHSGQLRTSWWTSDGFENKNAEVLILRIR